MHLKSLTGYMRDGSKVVENYAIFSALSCLEQHCAIVFVVAFGVSSQRQNVARRHRPSSHYISHLVPLDGKLAVLLNVTTTTAAIIV